VPETTLKYWTTTPQKIKCPVRNRGGLIALPVRRLLACGVILAALGSLCVPAGRTQDAPTEYQVKAAFLFNFAKFVDWPESSFATPQSPFSLCVLGVDPFGRALDDALAGKAIANRPVLVSRLKEPASARQCQIAFISSSEKVRWPAIFGALRGANVLLVGEADGFAASGGTIQFTLEENRVRFSINTDAAERAHLQISSKLLALAKIVRDAPNRRRD